MINSKNILVDVPKVKGVHAKTAGTKGEKYVYKYTEHYRNAEGKPRNKAISIGKMDMSSGKMIPNSNYYEQFKIEPNMSEMCVWDYGYAYVVQKCADESGIGECLSETFGAEKALEIIVVASYMMSQGNAMDGIDDWLERTYFEGYRKALSPQGVSRLFEGISEGSQHEFFKRWAKMAMTGGNICYDVTSISSYSETMTGVEYGYNRDGEEIAQFNLGMFVDEDTKAPIYYNRYNGSLTDKSNLSYVLENAKGVGIEKVKIVVDGGFISGECIQNLAMHSEAFTTGVPMSLNMAKGIYETHSSGIGKYANKLADYEVYADEKAVQFHGISGRLILFFDPMNHAQLCNEMSERIRSLAAELSALKRYPKDDKLKRYSGYFKLTRHETGGGFDFEPDNAKIDELRSAKGFFAVFTTDHDASPNDILYHYRAKDAAEKLFDQLKIDMHANRFRTHSEATTSGKTFVAFVALVLRTVIAKKLKSFLAANSSSLKKVFNQLDNIIAVSSPRVGRFFKALSKKQKDILDAFLAYDSILCDVHFCLR
jgi:transposase